MTTGCKKNLDVNDLDYINGKLNDSVRPIVFRNYKPVTDLLDGMYVIKDIEPQPITHLIEDKLQLIADETPCPNKTFEPQNVNWDLKRRLGPRMAALDRATQKQIKKYVNSKKTKKNET